MQRTDEKCMQSFGKKIGREERDYFEEIDV
jgi:hypothetical protein